jgi:hypothetical protein
MSVIKIKAPIEDKLISGYNKSIDSHFSINSIFFTEYMCFGLIFFCSGSVLYISLILQKYLKNRGKQKIN